MGWFGKKQDLPKETPRSPQGLSIFASASSGDVPPLPRADDKMEIIIVSPKPRLYGCGHLGAKSFKLHTYGEVTKDLRDCECCPVCQLERFKKFTIRCALCRLIILPGDGVALYGQEGPVHMGIATKVGTAVIGCMRIACCPSGGFFAGNWTEEGFKSKFESNKTAAEQVVKENS